MAEKKSRAEYAAIVARPGKFEGEEMYVPYFWDLFLEGCADEDDGNVAMFRVTDEDRALFPELARGECVRLFQRSDGFVCEQR